MKKKLEKKWAEWKPTVFYIGVCTAVTGVVILIGRDVISKEVIQRLDSERKYLKKELHLAEDVAWDYHDLAMQLLQKHQPTSEELEKMAKSWSETKTI
jgi:hypothetical protein